MTPAEAAGILGLHSAAAGAPEVRAAFRRLSRRAHPDQGGTAERFQELVTARDVLTTTTPPPPAADPDPVRRRLTPDDFAGPAARATDDESEIADVLRQFDEALKATSFADLRRASRQVRRQTADPLTSIGHHVAPDGTVTLSDLPAGAVVIVGPDGSVVVEAGPHRRTFPPR